MSGSHKAIKIALEAEKTVLVFLTKNGPTRPHIVGLQCMPTHLKAGTHKQWANRVLLRLQMKDQIESYKSDFGTTLYKVKQIA
jgi:hypothetical protein